MECKRCGLPPLLSHFPNQLKLGKIRRSPTVGEAGGTNTVSVAFFPREPWAIRMEKRTVANAVSWSEFRRAFKLWKYRKRYFLHNKKAQRSIKLLLSNVFYVQRHSRLTAERHWSAMLLRRSDSLRLETCPDLRSKSREVPCESHRTLVRCHFARRADGDPLGKTDSKQAVACWSERQRTLPFCPANRRCAA